MESGPEAASNRMDLNSGLGGLWTYVEAACDPGEEHNAVAAPGMEAGEAVLLEVDDVVFFNTNLRGSILLTTLQLLFIGDGSPEPVALGSFPLATIERVFKLQPSRAGVPSKAVLKLLQVQGKDLRTAVYAFQPRTRKRTAVQDALLRALPRSLLDLHAWLCPAAAGRDPSTSVVRGEYERLLSLLEGQAGEWRISDVNANYTVCSTYPSLLVLPARFSNDEVHAAAAFRARGRLPVFCWQHPVTGAVLSRSGQPLVGIMLNSRSDADEKLVAALTGVNKAAGQPRKLIIADARPRKNALANGALGGGSEPSSHYRSSEVVYLGIDNIHTMRDSGARLREYLDLHGAACSDGSSSLLRSGGMSWAGGSTSSTAAAAAALVDTGWLQHLHALLAGAAFIAAHIAMEGDSVLVHCSDGWDRTPALLCTALLMLDPYYCTFAGFQALVEVHWAAFGHQFAERMGVPACSSISNSAGPSFLPPETSFSASLASTSCSSFGGGGGAGNASSSVLLSRSSGAHMSSNNCTSGNANSSNAANMAPIFLQWVDCVAQLLRLFPRAFEFSTAFLVDLLDATIACRFGNFLFNSERERRQSGVWQHCSSVWDHLAADRRSEGPLHRHHNLFYAPKAATALLPPAAALAPILIPEIHLRWSCPPSAQTSRGGALPRWWEECPARQELQQKAATLLSMQQTMTEAERRVKALEKQVKDLQLELEAERRDKEASQKQAAQVESEKVNLRRALEATGATCHMHPARPSSPRTAAMHHHAAPCVHTNRTCSCGLSQSNTSSSSQTPSDALAVSLSLPFDGDFCHSPVCKACSKSKSLDPKRGWSSGLCNRGNSSFSGLRADFEALSQLSLKDTTLKETYFGSAQSQVQEAV